MPSCCIKNCKSHTGHNAVPKNIRFHKFPKERTVRQQWLIACQRKESDIKVDVARVCSIHFEENCFELVKTKQRVRLKKGSIPTKFLKLEKKRRRRMSQSKKDNKNIKVPGKSFVPTYTELVQYAQQEQRLSQEETVTKMETDVAQNMEEAVKNMERNTLQDTKEKVSKNIDKVATQNMEEQNKAIKQQIKQGIDRIDDNLIQLKLSQRQNERLLAENQNLVEKNLDLSTQVRQLQAKIKNMKNIDKVATQNIEEQSEALKQQLKQEINNNLMQLKLSKELNRNLLDKNKNLEEKDRDLSTQVSQLQAEIKNMTKNKHKEAKIIAIAALRKISRIPGLSSEHIAGAVSLL